MASQRVRATFSSSFSESGLYGKNESDRRGLGLLGMTAGSSPSGLQGGGGVHNPSQRWFRTPQPAEHSVRHRCYRLRVYWVSFPSARSLVHIWTLRADQERRCSHCLPPVFSLCVSVCPSLPRTDPWLWTEQQVCQWLLWATSEFSLVNVNLQRFGMNGHVLCNLGKERFLELAPDFVGDILWEHLEQMIKGTRGVGGPGSCSPRRAVAGKRDGRGSGAL